MTKKILAMLCCFAVLVCVFTSAAAQANAAEADYQVGFARVDINPYVVDGDITSGIMELPLRGSGDVWNRLSTYGLIDDNGDGKIDEEDGLAVTCIAVTDSAGKTVLLITIDLIGGGMITKVREAICTRVDAALTSGEISNVDLAEDQIYYAGTHTHNAPDTTVYNANGKTGTNDEGKALSVINENLGIWIDRTIEDIADAAILALKDRAPAKLVKDQISASESQSAAVKGKVMNSVRHYVNEAGGCVAGDNFNTRGSNPQQVTQVNDTMYLLQFDFSEHNANSNDDKLNIILANWRGHPSLNNNDSYYGSRNCISSDFPNAFRHTLEYGCPVTGPGVCDTVQDYRVAFFQAAGGNVNPRGYEKTDGVSAYAWIDNLAKTNKECRGNGYGRTLAAMAKEGIRSSANAQAVEAGAIQTVQYVYNSNRRTTGISALAYEAAKAYQATANVKNPFVYTSASGEIYVIGSKFHANNIISYWDYTLQEPETDLVDMELNVFMFGQDLAFVTAPGEPFDYYYNPDGSNAWDNLISETYGTPFVLGYCNGAKGYIPNSKAYDYNLGSEKWARGSYETSITPYAQGTGEHMIALFEDMLEMLSAGESYTFEGPCQHCKGDNVTWEPYNGQSMLYTGHYYLRGDTSAKQIHIAEGEQVCFDLNGYTLKSENRVFYTSLNGGSTLSLMDSSDGQTGVAMGCGGNYGVTSGYSGGTVIVDTGNTFNFYSGTLTVYQTSVRAVYTGGILRNKGTFNMYGGVITGGVGYSFTGTYLKSKVPTAYSREGYAAAVHSSNVFNMYGGRIDAGEFKLITGTVSGNQTNGYTYSQTVQPWSGKGIALYVSGTLNISGNATVADIYFADSSADILNIDTSEKPYTGAIQLTFGTDLDASMDIGNCTLGTQLPDGAITFTNGQLTATVNGTDIYAVAGAVIQNAKGGFTYYSSLAEALKNYTYSSGSRNFIKLLGDVSEAVTISKNTYLDLNGRTVSGAVSVAENATLYCMDAATDDYTVADGIYGKLAGTVTGTVKAVPDNTVSASENGYRFGYMMLRGTDGISFHRLKVQVCALSLRPDTAGMYYTGAFGGDELVKENILEFGIVLNAYEAPAAANMNSTSLCVSASSEQWSNTGTVAGAMLTGIMKQENSAAQNAENAAMPVYGRAYVLTADGYVFSETANYSLRQLVETADEANVIRGEGLTKMVAMYELYAQIMEQWNLPRLRLDMQTIG